MVENIVAIELAYVNTRHPDFYKGIPALTEPYVLLASD